ncbi:threonine aldolase [Desulfosarcina widdelii]|uniref:Threonine aldolase n=1 Tax=Desulfosarcina widdelii TaxID=947919 RepID=A0A5K7Z443_9BACT|nr:alanine racemase [Desulfosarcina widdelii]BBO73244.1 threonine aldolase [Desulfosarcina widdelii]
MDFAIHSLSEKPYKISALSELTTPCLLLFRDRFDFNIKRMGKLLDLVSPGFPIKNIWPHVKTHKSKWVTRELMTAGFQGFKATPMEAEMLIDSGVETIFIAYPLLPAEADHIASLVKGNPDKRIIVQAAHQDHATYLSEAAEKYDIQWHFFIDLNVGMNRTGTDPEGALGLYNLTKKNERFKFFGIHAYDGHNAFFDEKKRRETSQASVEILTEAVRRFENRNISVPRVMMSGTPSFLPDLECLSHIDMDADIILSPGNWIFFDTWYHQIIPNTFDVAALILVQVMDRPNPKTATLNLGYKRWGIDQGKIEGFSIEGMEALGWSEEHTIVSVPHGTDLHIGDYILVAPRHACSTVNLWEYFAIIGPDGEIDQKGCPIDARNR